MRKELLRDKPKRHDKIANDVDRETIELHHYNEEANVQDQLEKICESG